MVGVCVGRWVGGVGDRGCLGGMPCAQGRPSHLFPHTYWRTCLPSSPACLSTRIDVSTCSHTHTSAPPPSLGVMIMTHGDDKGLVLPPRVAPKQVSQPAGVGFVRKELLVA